MRRVAVHAGMRGWCDEGNGDRESDPTEEREKKDLLALLELLGKAPPHGRRGYLNERPEADEQAALGGVHAQLFEIDGDQGEEGAEGGKEEEIEGLCDQEIVVDMGAHHVYTIPGGGFLLL